MERWQRISDQQGNAPLDDVPFVLARDGHHGPVVHAANRAARTNGITQGARIVDMRAICPDLQVGDADIAGDRAALDQLVLWARRWCPWSVRDGDDGMILDTTGSDHLLGGEAAMLVDMETQMSLLGLQAHLAVAPTWGAAWALARFGPARSICTQSDITQQISSLPVSALRLTGETVILLRRLGLKTIGAVQDVPRRTLARRFVRAPLNANPLMRMDQVLGTLAEPVASQDAAPRLRAHSRLAEPVLDPKPYLPKLCEDLCTALQTENQGCRRLHLQIYRTDGDVSHVTVATSAVTRDPDHLYALFRDKIERINPGFGFDLITLEAADVEDMPDVQIQLDGRSDDDLHITRLVDRLSAKFGPRAVTHPVAYASHIPERAERHPSALARADHGQPTVVKDRPLRLFDHPEEIRVLYAVPEGPPVQFVWRRQTHRITRYSGPERISPEWWKDRPSTRLRDYFKIENQYGQRFWLYREGLHADGRGGDPRWFVHGCFA